MREPWSRTGDTGEDILQDSEHPPTSAMVGVTRLSHPDFLIEIDLVAITEA
jgi:enamine deaminase RidA (YjgF/YER057c/UK114 family)